MVTEQIIRLLRRKVAEVDPNGATDVDDVELLPVLSDALITLKARKIVGFETTTVDLDPSSPTYGVTPELPDAQGMILVLRAAVDVLEEEYQGRLRRGELGVSWKSGLEEESTTAAAGHYRDRVGQLETELRALVLIQSANRSLFRNQ